MFGEVHEPRPGTEYKLQLISGSYGVLIIVS
jgi:hypothetical protein